MAGIYIHIPFCKQACTYCDFHFSTTFEKYRTQMIDAICVEIKRRKQFLKGESIESIYFGGGTPSVLNNLEIEQLLLLIKSEFYIVSNCEVTLEANPDDITDEKLNFWKKSGINRLSIGVQSFRQEDLDWMNRAHNVTEAKQSIKKASKMGFDLSLDLIYGLPNFTVLDFKNNIDELLKIKSAHISAYCLTIEEKTALDAKVKKGEIIPSGSTEQEEQFNFLIDYLKENKYEQYEVSNFAINQNYAKHNSNYWLGKMYLGVGPSAHSFDGENRAWNIANNQKYLKCIAQDQDCFETEILDAKTRFNEAFLTGLRTKWGVDLTLIDKAFLDTNDFKTTLEEILEKKYAFLENNKLILTQEGKLFADAIASDFFIVD